LGLEFVNTTFCKIKYHYVWKKKKKNLTDFDFDFHGNFLKLNNLNFDSFFKKDVHMIIWKLKWYLKMFQDTIFQSKK
jgi:hypothetical protein